MAKEYNHFIPANDEELSVWTNPFEEKLPGVATLLGISEARVTEAQDATLKIREGINKHSIKKQEYQESVAYKKLLRSREVKVLVRLAVDIKRNPLYTENIGKELGIIGSATSADRSPLRPSLKVKAEHGYVSVSFNKKGQTGVSIFTRLRGTVGWEKLVSGATRSPYKDERPLQQEGIAEIREYTARYWDNATEIGSESDIAFTLFGG